MMQKSDLPSTRRSAPNPIWVPALLVIALVAGFAGDRFLMRTPSGTPQTRLADGIKDLRAQYDQGALALLKPLADEGNPKAQYWLADIDENGLGVKRDMTAALDLLDKAANHGFEPAERHLGELYLRGDETLQNFGKAETWLQKAALAGDAEAQQELGQIYALGLGVAADPSEAYGWYENAVVGGDGLAAHVRDDLLTRMSPAQIAKGEADAKDIAAQLKAAPETPVQGAPTAKGK